MGEPFGAGFGGLVRSHDLVDRDGIPPVYYGTQRRLVEHPKSHATYWVEITVKERDGYIAACPKGWGRLIALREGGMPVEEIARRERMDYEEIRDFLAMAYAWVEQKIHKLAAAKIGIIEP